MKKKSLLLILLMALLAPWAAKAQSLCDPSDQCEITYALVDSYGDGWNGGKITVTDVTASTQLATWTISSGSSANGSLAVCIGHEIQFSYTTGNYAYENSWTIYDVTGATIWEGSGSDGAQSETYTVVCPSCYPPTDFHATLTPGDGTIATLSWTKGNDESNWVLQYSTNSTFASDVTTYDGGFTIEGTTVSADLMMLTPETTYYARVKADCGGGDESDWNSSLTFKPTNQQYTLVYDGTPQTTNSYVPIYGYYEGYYQKTEIVYPASALTALNGKLIKTLKFYSTTANASFGAGYKVFMKEVDATTISDFSGYNVEDVVYEGSLSIAGNEMTIEFDNEYEYCGGNLLIGIYHTEYTSSSYTSRYFNGQSITGASVSGYNSSSLASVTATQRNFIPKTQFGHFVNPYPMPSGIAYNNVDPTHTTISWTAPVSENTITGYSYQYKTGSDDWSAATTVTSTSVSLTLEPETAYDFRVKANYEGGHESSFATISWTTLASCMTPENLTITNVTWNSATFNWTEGYGAGQWKLGYKTGSDDYTYVDVTLAELPKTLSVFEEQTTYDVVVYPLCDDGKTIVGSFTTLCNPETVGAEWKENFESYTATTTSATTPATYPNDVLPDCWTWLNRSATSSTYPQVFLSSHSSYAVSGNCLFFKSSHTTPLYATLPAFSDNLSTLQVTFTYRNEGTGGSHGTLYVGYMTDPKDANTFTSVYTCVQTTTKTEKTVELTSAPNNGYIAFKYIGAGDYDNYYASIDDIIVETIPTCLRPYDVTKSNVTNHSAKITWKKGSSDQTAWQLKYSDAAFDPTSAGTLVDNLSDTTYTFNKTLDPATTYYVYVRANCGGGDYSKWSKTVCSFTTESAAPALTTFNKTGVGPNWVDLYWNQSAGDLLSGYGIYYSTTSTAPTAETAAIVTINNPTAPTSEAPYRLTGLENETKYYIWVRANHEANVYSAWKAINGAYFTTLVACPAPTGLAANSITHTTADLTWTDYSDSYTVEYQTSAYDETLFFEDFESGSTGWTTQIEGEGPGWALSTNYSHSPSHSMTVYSYDFDNGSEYNADNWLISPQITMGKTLKFWAYQRYGDEYEVLFSTSNSISSFDTELQAMATVSPSQTWVEFTVDLTAIMGQTGYIAIHHVMYDGGWLSIDDFGIYGDEVPAGGWTEATTSATDGAYTIEGLTVGTKYDVRVKGNCGGEYSDVCSFTTYNDNTKIFKTAGNWNVAGNWDGGIPENTTQNVIIRANVTIPSGYIAKANNVTIQGTPAPTITLASGGQLLHSTDELVVTSELSISGYGSSTNGGYHLISIPSYYDIGDISVVENLIATTPANYDLYAFDATEEGSEWRNYKAGEFTTLNWGQGYLYANAADQTTLRFTGSVDKTNGFNWSLTGNLSYTGATAFDGWTLVGNWAVSDLYLSYKDGDTPVAADFYVMNPGGTGFITSSDPLAPGQGAFVYSEEDGVVYGTTTAPATRNSGLLNINVNSSNTLVDQARLRFNEGRNLGKMSFNANSTKIYIPQENKDYAVVYAEAQGEMPVCFKAAENGTYTISFTTENVDFSYLHLIDNMTGNDVDLLENSSYTFDARYTDYASRFKLVFKTSENGNENDNFGFISNGNLMILGIEGEATLQMIDVTGRILSTENFSGSYNKAVNEAAGVYMIRLIQGENVRTQKIVVR